MNKTFKKQLAKLDQRITFNAVINIEKSVKQFYKNMCTAECYCRKVLYKANAFLYNKLCMC